MFCTLLALSLLGQRPSDVCVVAPDAVLIAPGKINWVLQDPAFRVASGTRASVLRINPERTEGVAEIRLIDATRRVAWVASSSLTPVQNLIVFDSPRAPVARPPAVAADLKPNGITVQQARRARIRANNSEYDALLSSMMQGMTNQTLAVAQAGSRPGPGWLSPSVGSLPGASSGGGYYEGPRQPSGFYLGGVGSSHKGGSYVNQNTDNRYQKRSF